MTAPSEQLAAFAATLPNGATPAPGVVTAGQPSVEHLTHAAQAGCRTVLDLRTPDEPRGYDEARAAQAADLEYVNVPVTYDGLGAAEFDRVRELLRHAPDQPVLVHCASANRVGAVLLPWLVLDQGHARDAAFDLACAVGLRHPGLVDAAFQYLDERSS